jgi:hypothetical protein
LARWLLTAALALPGSFAHAQSPAVDDTAVATPVITEEEEIANGTTPNVALAQFTSAVEDREPADAISFLGNDQRSITFYTDLRGLTGNTISHRWEYDGKVMADVQFVVKGDRWRVWSSKDLDPAWLGDWTVSVIKEDGELLASERFTYQKAE